MAASHLNPDVKRTAARHLVKAMTRVNPMQREELLIELIQAAEMSLRVIRTGSPEARKAA